MDCRLKLYLWPSWLRCFSFTFRYFCVSGGSQFKTKTFLMTTSERHTILLVLWDLHSVTLPKWLSKYDPTRYIKCILVVSLCHCIWSGVFQVFQTISWTTESFKFTIFFLSLWNWEILEVSWFEIERNTLLDFTPTKGVEENCFINCEYFQGFKRKTGKFWKVLRWLF